MGNSVSHELVRRHSVISDQVSPVQIQIILDELEQCLDANADGAVVEFGCYIGTTSLFIRRLLDELHDDRPFHVYDSFEGLPAKTSEDASPAGIYFQAGELAVSKKQFLHEFQKAHLRPPTIHKGWFADLTDADVPDQIAFAFLDGDFYDSIRDSLALVLPRLTPHATLIIDDYAREALPGAARAVIQTAPHLAARLSVQHDMGIIRL